jgi:type II secretory pathway pseudopilin PulG
VTVVRTDLRSISSGHTRGGFTAIELIIVISIVIILAAMVMPSIGPAMKRGAVNDAATAIQRACSVARQLARTYNQPTGGATNWYGVAVVVPSEPNKPAYAVVIYDNTVSYSRANDENYQYPNQTPFLDGSGVVTGYKPAAKFPFSRNVMPVKSDVAGQYDFMTPGAAVGWFYQYRTGFLLKNPPSEISTLTNLGTVGVSGTGMASPQAFGVASLDRKYIVAIAIYGVGLVSAQDVN